MQGVIRIDRQEACRLAVISQGLHRSAAFGSGRNAVLRTITHLGYVQLDTISVLERAHHHILRSRIPSHRAKHLYDLQVKHRKVLEYWAHAAAFLPMKDYRFAIPTMEYFRQRSDPWPKADRTVKYEVLERIRTDGPLRSRDFKPQGKRKGAGWWDWKPTKLALQRLFFEGRLVVSHRAGFQRVYDIPERVIPADTVVTAPSDEEYADYLIDSFLRSHGFGDAGMISYLRKGMRKSVEGRLTSRSADGELVELGIRGLEHRIFYSTRKLLERLDERVMRRPKLLSPFDNLVIQRKRLRDIFGFDYQIECYVPKPKRVYGYYVLPVICGNKFTGRIDARADRKNRTLVIENYHTENDLPFGEFIHDIAASLGRLAKHNACDSICPGQTLGKDKSAALTECSAEILSSIEA